MMLYLKQKLINPVLEKEFRLRLRTIRSPLALMFYLFAIGLIAFGFMYMMFNDYYYGGMNPERSREMFYFLSGVQLFLILFMTPGLTAGVISSEREKQTLNILLTTQQSSTTIILSKLFSSISFMILIVFATLPIYSIVFLFGGISPSQVVFIFLFYIFLMFSLGAFGILFSTIFKKTMIAIITTYGTTIFLYGFTGLAAIFFESINRGVGSNLVGFLLSLNPLAALISMYDSNFTEQMFRSQKDFQIWEIFVFVYFIIMIICILLSIRFLRPALKKKKLKQS
ncbi:ABC transporter permease [Chengkuizengella axinellae]|uniref:ABC transporter permease n=1 Tax=Chengkuizengella axinellae TaxID=3064388 RepID=A0ABT9IWF7_9BACL|nr:ABC transporter permease [Chengkuizengella sp. 2205SS18-9]MDP5273120.1 ABC transporter permease [Chengkuizengella sp. 2205SS18-9]